MDYCMRLISEIYDALDYYEATKEPIGIQKARRILMNDLPQAIKELGPQEIMIWTSLGSGIATPLITK